MKTLYSIDKSGNEKLVGYYDLYPQNYDGQFQIYDQITKKYGLVDNKGVILINCEMDQIGSSIYFDTILVKKNGLYGFYDTIGNCFIECKYEMALDFCGEFAAVKDKNHDAKYYLISKDDKRIKNIEVDYLSNPFKKLIIPFKLENKWGFLNNKGEIIIENIYDNFWEFNDGVISVEKKGKWGVINEKGDIILDFIYEDPITFYEDLAIIKEKNKKGFIDKTGKIIIPIIYNDVDIFRDGFSIVTNSWKSWFINMEGSELTSNRYDKLTRFGNSDLSRFTKNGMMGFLNKKGEEIIEGKYLNIDFFREGLASYKIKDKIYFINTIGELVIERKCTSANSFQDGTSRVKSKKLYGFIDKKNNLIIDYKYTYATDFFDGYAIVQKEI